MRSISWSRSTSNDYVPAPEPPKGRIWLTAPFVPLSLGGAAYIASLPKLDRLADSNEGPGQSTIVLHEDEKPVGPGHSEHADVATLGRGRYSHWKGQGLIFSATDNSNPNQNWKRYSVTIEPPAY